MDTYLAIVVGLLGLCVGSFLNVCIYRIPLEKSLLRPPSHCPSCKRPLRWFENVPVFGWIALRGRCRTCGTPISAEYPIVEALTAAVFLWAWWQYGWGWLFASRVLFGCSLLVLFFIDLHHRILPNVITLPGIVIGFLLSLVNPPGWVSSLIGLVVGGLIPLAVAEIYLRIRGDEGLGMGDVKMLAMIGAFLGWQGVLGSLFLGALIGTLIFLPMKLAGREKLVPFGIFLAIGAAAMWLFGEPMLGWYLGMIRPA